MLITDYLKQDCIAVDLKGETKEEAIINLADLIFKKFNKIAKKETIKCLFERENIMTTGIGEGIAIPHARISGVQDIITAFGFLKKAVDFNSIDNKPVRLMVLILFPNDQVGSQLKYLARVSRLLKRNVLHDDLFNCKTSAEIYRKIKEYENIHFY